MSSIYSCNTVTCSSGILTNEFYVAKNSSLFVNDVY
jgi:hypothetical protein